MTDATAPVLQIDPARFHWESPVGVAEGVRRVVAEATAADGRSPLNEATLLGLRHHGVSSATLWVAGPPDEGLTGFALADAPADTSDGTSAGAVGSGEVEVNLVVRPGARRRGTGHDLSSAVLDAFPGANLSAWSHGNHPGAAALAADLGFERVRDLWVMRRSLTEPLPEVTAPGASVVRPFEPGRDEEAFLELNAAAFAHHPEQGAMTRADLDQRMAETWFDPAGFFLAEASDDGRLLGFHWTKMHPEDPPYGEVYVVGVAPDAQGLGLGKVLTLTGLHHLRSLGLGEVILYVEADNDAAIAVYRGLGFGHAEEDTDVMYRRAGNDSVPGGTPASR